MLKREWKVKEYDQKPNWILEEFCYKGSHRNGPYINGIMNMREGCSIVMGEHIRASFMIT